MIPITIMNDIDKRISTIKNERMCYFGRERIIIGILFADAREPRNQAFMKRYINQFDKESGYQFDFFIPGYGVKNEFGERNSPNTHVIYEPRLDIPIFGITRTGVNYYFQEKNYDESVKELCGRLCIRHRKLGKRQPILVLTEIDISNGQFQDYMFIELRGDEDQDLYARLFEKVFAETASGDIRNLNKKVVLSYFTRPRDAKKLSGLIQATGLVEEIYRAVDGSCRFRVRKNPKGINNALIK